MKPKGDLLSTYASFVDLGVESGDLVTVCLVPKDGGAVCGKVTKLFAGGKVKMGNTTDHLMRHPNIPLTSSMRCSGSSSTAELRARPRGPLNPKERSWTSPTATSSCNPFLSRNYCLLPGVAVRRPPALGGGGDEEGEIFCCPLV